LSSAWANWATTPPGTIWPVASCAVCPARNTVRPVPATAWVKPDGRGSSGAVTPVDFSELAQVRLLDEGGREVAESDVGD
jgi:hypothetical protein